MGFGITVAYIILTYLSPAFLMASLAPYRPMLILAILGLFASILPICSGRSFALRARQTYLMLGLILAVFASEIVHLWFGGVLTSAEMFLPSATVFFLVVANVNTWFRLRVTVIAVVICALILICISLLAYRHHDGTQSLFILQDRVSDAANLEGTVARIRSVGTLNDPNDFAQFLLVTVPLLGLMWKPSKLARNLLVVSLIAVIAIGVVLTRSRGGLVAIFILLLILLRRRVGHVASLVITSGTFMAALALNFTGNRGISIEGGMDRLAIWSDGLALFKQSPLFGVGFGQFTESSSYTAHNSFLLCFSELGLFGFFFWMGLLVVTVLELNALVEGASPAELPLDSPISVASTGATASLSVVQNRPDSSVSLRTQPELADPRRWAKAIRLSLLAFAATGWFLSRTYVALPYLIIGLAVALNGLSGGGIIAARERKTAYSWVTITVVAMLGIIALVYLSVRIRVFS